MTTLEFEPESPADAILIARSLADSDIAANLELVYGPEVVERVHENAIAWMQQRTALATPAAAEVIDRVDAGDYPTDDEGYVTFDFPALTEKEPQEFRGVEAKVALSAVRQLARVKGNRRLGNDFLAQKAPSRPERFMRRLAVTSMVYFA